MDEEINELSNLLFEKTELKILTLGREITFANVAPENVFSGWYIASQFLKKMG